MPPSAPPLVVIAGPTASGKTAAAVRVAERIGAEIVGADSQQVYRHFDIGTAKPSLRELSAVPHHLISVLEPDAPCTAGRYQQLADEAIARIQERGRRVVVVGGTGLYLRVLLHGVMPAPPVDAGLRAKLEAQAREEGAPALHARLREVDPETAARLPASDVLRVVRALELFEQTGEPASVHRARHAFAPDRYAYELAVLEPPRDALYERINQRAREMFEGGLLEEVKSLLARGYGEAPAMGSVGYVQARDVVEGRCTLEEGIAAAAQATRHYAKRQLTWFRKERGARFLQPPYAMLDALGGRASKPVAP